ncbi:MAG TPA: uroporphyrinogen decarboxylase family protein, partial [Trueperaceae bacterium]|nr:uroporphyrinogen decarboxylase family protein [Trueperaceae bacterium]
MSLFLDALAGHDTARAPLWLMRQAGRYLPEYRALKERYSFWEMVRTPDLAAEVTMQPLRRFGMDAAILFQDIMTPLPAMGVDLEFAPGPVISRPVRSAAAAAALRVPEQEEIAPFAGEAIRLVAAATATPLIGFAGAPLTLASYLIEGGGSKDFATFRAFLQSQPEA